MVNVTDEGIWMGSESSGVEEYFSIILEID